MLSEVQVVKIRKTIESTYNGICNIIERQKVTNANHSTSMKEVTVLENQPCRLSFKSISNTTEGETVATTKQSVKLFISPDIVVKAGSKIIVTQDGETTEYKSSGIPAVYGTHQEIILELFKEWA